METFSRPLDPCTEHCPARIRETLDLISAKWAVPIFLALYAAEGPVRFAALEKALPGITAKELSKNLRKFELAGLVRRVVHPTMPPTVDYRLDDLGDKLYPSLRGLALWSAEFGDEVERRRNGARRERLGLIPYAGRA